MKLSSAYLGHHGLVSGLYDELGIGEIIDKTYPNKDNTSYRTLSL
jgi:hypothetical protein